MKNLLIVLFITILISCNHIEENTSYKLTGMIEGVSSGNVFLLASEFKDTTKIENGKFVFKGMVKEPCLSKLVFEGLEDYKEFYIENSNIKFNGSVDNIENAQISGSKTETERISYNSMLSAFDKRYSNIENEYETADDLRKVELDILLEKLEMEQVEAQKVFIRENSSSYLGINILREIDWSFSTAEEFNEYIMIFDTILYKYKGLVLLKEQVARMERVDIGKTAPDFEISDIDGKMIRLSDKYSGSKYLLLDFWASTCGPCRKENKHILAAYNKYHSRGFDVLGVSTDTNKEMWFNAIEKDGLLWTNTSNLKEWNDNELVQAYALRQVSANFLIDNSGVIIASDLRGDDLQRRISELLMESEY